MMEIQISLQLVPLGRSMVVYSFLTLLMFSNIQEIIQKFIISQTVLIHLHLLFNFKTIMIESEDKNIAESFKKAEMKEILLKKLHVIENFADYLVHLESEFEAHCTL